MSNPPLGGRGDTICSTYPSPEGRVVHTLLTLRLPLITKEPPPANTTITAVSTRGRQKHDKHMRRRGCYRWQNLEFATYGSTVQRTVLQYLRRWKRTTFSKSQTASTAAGRTRIRRSVDKAAVATATMSRVIGMSAGERGNVQRMMRRTRNVQRFRKTKNRPTFKPR